LVVAVILAIVGGLYWFLVLNEEETTDVVEPVKVSTPSSKQATPSAEKEKDETAKWKRYTSPIGFQIEHPEDYQILEDPGPPSETLSTGGVTFLPEGVKEEDLVPVMWISYRKPDKVSAEYDSRKTENTTIAGYKAVRATDNLKFREDFWIFSPNNSKSVRASYDTRGIEEPLRTQYFEIYVQMLSTFKFLPSQ